MPLGEDCRVLYHLLLAPKRGTTTAERLESFYSGQAELYDAFRARLLQGRRELVSQLPSGTEDAVWVDLGGGTGANLELAGDRKVRSFASVYVVDLCPSLLHVAQRRIERCGWGNVRAVGADAASYVPPEGTADVVTLSYSLTMMPDWMETLDHAFRLLRPGGTIGVVDFYVARKHPPEGWVRHRWATRTFWPTWFAFDDVFLSPEHPIYLHRRFHPQHFEERRAKLPYFPIGRAPYYLFLGTK